MLTRNYNFFTCNSESFEKNSHNSKNFYLFMLETNKTELWHVTTEFFEVYNLQKW